MIDDRPPPGDSFRPSASFWAVGLALLVANFVRAWPIHLVFVFVTTTDLGWALGTDALIADGLVPTRDFSYFYGLLALVIDRGWFAALGRTPVAQAGLFAVCNLAVFAGMVAFARGLGFGRSARLLMLVALPFAVMPTIYPSPVHGLEAALLAVGLGLQALGRPGTALVPAVLVVFVKPSIGYLFCGLLTTQILFLGSEPRLLSRVRRLAPAGLTAAVCVSGLVAWFGVEPLMKTLFPVAAITTYAAENYGFFFGVGRRFWLPDRPTPAYYFFTYAGFWVVSTLVLLVGGVRLIRAARDPRVFSVVTCLVLHLTFVVFLFGNDGSWIYDSVVLLLGVCGVAAMRLRGPTPTWAARILYRFVLPGLVLAGSASTWMEGLRFWNGLVPSPDTGGLFALPEDAAGWRAIRNAGREKPVLFLGRTYAPAVLFPELTAPRGWYLLPPSALPVEVEQIRSQIRTADRIVVPSYVSDVRLDVWPAFREEMAAFALEARYPSFEVYRRRHAPAGRGKPGTVGG
jgi:hypothetical protein